MTFAAIDEFSDSQKIRGGWQRAEPGREREKKANLGGMMPSFLFPLVPHSCPLWMDAEHLSDTLAIPGKTFIWLSRQFAAALLEIILWLRRVMTTHHMRNSILST